MFDKCWQHHCRVIMVRTTNIGARDVELITTIGGHRARNFGDEREGVEPLIFIQRLTAIQ
jgi:hypothetical protein